MNDPIVAIIGLGLLCATTIAQADDRLPAPDQRLQSDIEQTKPLRLTLVWGKTTQPLPGTQDIDTARNARQASSPPSSARPTAAFLHTARRISVAVEKQDSGFISNATADLAYRIHLANRQYTTDLAIDTRAPQESHSARTTLDLPLGQWIMAGYSSNYHSAQIGGQTVESITYYYQFLCLADAQGCQPALPVPRITP